MKYFLKALVVCVLMIFGSQALAKIEGKITGTGNLTEIEVSKNKPHYVVCNELSLEVFEKNNVLTLTSFYFNCGHIDYQDDSEIELEIQGDELWLDGKQVGTYTGDVISIAGDSGPANTLDISLIKNSSGEIEYKCFAVLSFLDRVYRIHGTLR